MPLHDGPHQTADGGPRARNIGQVGGKRVHDIDIGPIASRAVDGSDDETNRLTDGIGGLGGADAG